MKRWLLGAALGVGLLVPLAYAQTITYTDLSGSECWNAGQSPGGPSSFLCSDVLRNSRQKVVGALTGALTFGTGSLAKLRWGGLAMITTQPLAATAFTLPPNPVPDGAVAGFCNASGATFATTAISFTTSISQTLSTPLSVTTLAANTCAEVIFNRATTTWYRIR